MRRFVIRPTLRIASLALLTFCALLASGVAAHADESAAIGPAAPPRRVVAYFPIWLRNSGYSEQDIDFSIVTTVAHFAVTPRADGTIAIPDWGPFPDPALVSRTHAAGAKIVLVVGGDDAAATAGFSGLVASASTRHTFITNLMTLVTANNYDGVDLDWEFPASAADRSGLTALVSELRAALGSSRTLSLTAPASDYSGQWYDVKALIPNLDWLGAMTYDLASASWSPRADDNAPLYSPSTDQVSVDSSTTYFESRGVPASKLLIGLPFFGQRFDGASGIHQPLTSKAGAAVDYQAISALISDGWTVQRDSAGQVPYLTHAGSASVISYDDGASIAAKCTYAVAHGLGGAILWHLGQDGAGQPLLQAARGCR